MRDEPRSRSFRLTLPDRQGSPIVLASPHSGRDYPQAFLAQSQLDALTLRSSEDAFMEELLAAAPTLGVPLLAARVPRAYVDLNRSPEELDPALIEDVRMPAHNPRIASGLGVIPRVVAGGRAIRAGKMPRSEAERRIVEGWRPYHDALERLLRDTQRRFGLAVLIDMHSMPHEAVIEARGRRPQVVLGDRFGSTATAAVTGAIEAAFQAEGLDVVRNIPFAGAYVVQTHGRPGTGRHAVQVEIDRSLYMDEARVEPHEGFGRMSLMMERVLSRLITASAEWGGGAAMPLAAE